MEGPQTDYGRREGEGSVNAPQHLVPRGHGEFDSPGPSSYDQQHWGFPKPNQGIKMSADQKQNLEGGGDYELKRKKP